MGEAFLAGVRPGGLTSENEVRILLCHILREVGEPMSFDQLTGAILSDAAANYFECTDALFQLGQLGCLSLSEKNGLPVYTLTDRGREAADVLSRELPASVRERTVKKAREILRRARFQQENEAAVERTEDGYRLSVRIRDVGTDLLQLRAFFPTREEAQAACEVFLQDPEDAYRRVMAALLRETID